MTEASYVLAIDQGTTSTRALLLTAEGRIAGSAQREFTQYYPQPGFVEHDATEIWQSVLDVTQRVLAITGVTRTHIAALGITNQRETVVVWERVSGRPIHPAIVWQSRQTADACHLLQQQGWTERIAAKTGLLIDAYFSATKIQWILDHVAGAQQRAQRGELLCGTMESWLIWNLTAGQAHVTDISNASRTMLFNIHTLVWDEELLALFNVPRAMLPEVRSNSEIYGRVADHLPFLAGTPVAGAAGDQQAALFGQACFAPGALKNTYGTGCFLLMNTGTQPIVSQQGLLTTVAWKIGDQIQYALEGSVFIAGAAVQWLRDGLGLIASAAEVEELAARTATSEGVYLVPAFVGLGAPHWDMEARGAIFGLTRGTTKAHLARATLESLAYQTRDVVNCMEVDAGSRLTTLRVDGGAVGNDLLMQFQADILGTTVKRARVRETTALGAAFFAGLAVGVWTDLGQLEAIAGSDREFLPQMATVTRDALYAGWLDAVERTRSRPN